MATRPEGTNESRRVVVVVIPALDEEDSIGPVVSGLRSAIDGAGYRTHVLVADNGSRDATRARAQAAGAVVVHEPRRGYGSACLRALAMLPPDAWAVLFADGDGADDPADAPVLLAPLRADRCDLVIGSRASGHRAGLVEDGALAPAQRFGNALAAAVLAVGYRQPTTDLGPFRAITVAALSRLRMDDRDFGWTVQMQARAARLGLVTGEVAVHYRRRRTGRSKVSGDVRASVAAGRIILTTLWRERRFR